MAHLGDLSFCEVFMDEAAGIPTRENQLRLLSWARERILCYLLIYRCSSSLSNNGCHHTLQLVYSACTSGNRWCDTSKY
jgi:hypothetical protein